VHQGCCACTNVCPQLCPPVAGGVSFYFQQDLICEQRIRYQKITAPPPQLSSKNPADDHKPPTNLHIAIAGPLSYTPTDDGSMQAPMPAPQQQQPVVVGRGGGGNMRGRGRGGGPGFPRGGYGGGFMVPGGFRGGRGGRGGFMPFGGRGGARPVNRTVQPGCRVYIGNLSWNVQWQVDLLWAYLSNRWHTGQALRRRFSLDLSISILRRPPRAQYIYILHIYIYICMCKCL